MPIISVLMSVHNGLPYIREAVSSILNQTFRDLEFIIIDDGSTDGTLAYLESLDDERIAIIRHVAKQGLAKSLNEGARLCRGEFIARMDADDVSEPDRLEKQLSFLDSHSDTDVLGTAAITIDENGQRLGSYPIFTQHTLIKWRALFANPLIHPSVMLRRDVLIANPYDETFQNSQDYELWSRLIFKQGMHFANLDTPLLNYRLHGKSTTASKEKKKELSTLTMLDNIRRYIPVDKGAERLLRILREGNELGFKDAFAIHKLTLKIRGAFIRAEKTIPDDKKAIDAETRHMDFSLLKYLLRSTFRPHRGS